jgi:hypothetical protein
LAKNDIVHGDGMAEPAVAPDRGGITVFQGSTSHQPPRQLNVSFGHRRTSVMIAFVVSVNGQRVGTIGIGDNGVLDTIVCWSGRIGEPGDLRISFGGLDNTTDEHVRWPDPPKIKVGDTVTVQVVETDSVDTPTDRKTPAQLRQEEEEFLNEMEREHQARVHRKIDEELPPLRAPWELAPKQAEPGAAADGGRDSGSS